MDTVTVKKQDLVEKVKENREQHRNSFEEVLEAYRNKSVELLQEHINRIKRGAVETVRVALPAPKNHTADYDAVLSMLDMSVDDEITLTRRDYQRYVMDDWDWREEFAQTTAFYAEER